MRKKSIEDVKQWSRELNNKFCDLERHYNGVSAFGSAAQVKLKDLLVLNKAMPGKRPKAMTRDWQVRQLPNEA